MRAMGRAVNRRSRFGGWRVHFDIEKRRVGDGEFVYAKKLQQRCCWSFCEKQSSTF